MWQHVGAWDEKEKRKMVSRPNLYVAVTFSCQASLGTVGENLGEATFPGRALHLGGYCIEHLVRGFASGNSEDGALCT